MSTLSPVYDGNGVCYPTVNGQEVSSINKGESVVWKYDPDSDVPTDVIQAAKKANYSWEFSGCTPSKTKETRTATLESSEIAYSTSGPETTTKVSLSIAKEKIDCKPLTVLGAPVSGCMCVPVNKEVDLKGGPEVLGTWNVSGCRSSDMNFSYQWEDEVISDGSNTGSFSFTSKNVTKAPKVKVVNADFGSQEITCGEIKSVDGENPDYLIEIKDGTSIPKTKIPVKNNGCIYVKGEWIANGYKPSVKMVCGIRLAEGATPGMTLTLSYKGKSSMPTRGDYNVENASIRLGTLASENVNIENVYIEFTGEAQGGVAECGLQEGN